MPRTSRIEQTKTFNGTQLDAAPHALGPGFFQEDHNGDRKKGVWQRRKGMLHDDYEAALGPVTSLVGFDMLQGGFALLFVSGVDVYGFPDPGVDPIGASPGASGFGEVPFGDLSGFGE